uniref:Ankyrin repeat protein n=1 Tax=Pithovirus LCDPAC01 TaxID=2506600 RepID=A0A481YMV2_9VIRU|nr:MAG: ankyrin repeat protein [Pithovirus LCDPAC01]
MEIVYEYDKPKIIEVILNKGFWESNMFISLIGRSDVVKYLISRNVPIPDEALVEAGILGYAETVKTIVSEVKTVPEHILRDIICAGFVIETSEEDILTIVKSLYHNQLTAHDMATVASLGPTIVKYLLKNGAPVDTRAVKVAIEIGDLETIKILLEYKVPVDKAMTAFAFTKRLQIAKYLFENGSYIDSTAVKAAAESGNLEGVKYLIRNNAPIDSEVMNIAVGSWKLEDIKYLFENNVPVDNKTVLASAMKNRKVLDVVEYLLKKDIPITDASVRAADKRGHIELARYLYQTSFEQEMKDTIPVRDIIHKCNLTLKIFKFRRF